MSPSRRDYPSSLYPEVGSSYQSGGYSNNSSSNSNSGYSARRNSSHQSHGDYTRSRDYRHSDRNERRLGDGHDTHKDSRRSHSHDRGRNSNRKDSSKKRSGSIWERFLPADYRPSQADPEARLHRLSKEKECPGFDWTPGVALALIGATALFSVEKSLVKRQKKDYIER